MRKCRIQKACQGTEKQYKYRHMRHFPCLAAQQMSRNTHCADRQIGHRRWEMDCPSEDSGISPVGFIGEIPRAKAARLAARRRRFEIEQRQRHPDENKPSARKCGLVGRLARRTHGATPPLSSCAAAPPARTHIWRTRVCVLGSRSRIPQLSCANRRAGTIPVADFRLHRAYSSRCPRPRCRAA